MQLILASASPRRQDLIRLINHPVSIHVADVNEQQITTADPAQNALDTADLKAKHVAHFYQYASVIVIGADTNVALGDKILGKPVDAADAVATLQALRGRAHQTHTGIVVINTSTGEEAAGVSTSDVTMRPYSDAEIAAYVATGDPLDKAGSYAIQHPQFAPVAQLNGCYAGVMGLSICLLADLLNKVGAPVSTSTADHCRTHHFSASNVYEKLTRKG